MDFTKIITALKTRGYEVSSFASAKDAADYLNKKSTVVRWVLEIPKLYWTCIYLKCCKPITTCIIPNIPGKEKAFIPQRETASRRKFFCCPPMGSRKPEKSLILTAPAIVSPVHCTGTKKSILSSAGIRSVLH